MMLMMMMMIVKKNLLVYTPGNSMNLAINGERVSGQAVRDQNITAAAALANVVKSALGPMGLDKMLVDSIGDVIISNDGATILNKLEVEHPAAKILVGLAQQQDEDVGDGTTSVVIIAAELLKRANELVKKKLHPTTIISGYRLACKEACRFIGERLSCPVNSLDRDALIACAKTSLSSKMIGGSDAEYSDYFAAMAVDAVLSVRSGSDSKPKYPVSAINILKAHGQGQRESVLIKNGYAINCTIAAQGMPLSIKSAKIACLDMNLQRQRMNLGVSVTISDPEKLEAIRKRECEIVLERIRKILNSGANVIFTTKGIDDMCLKAFVEAKVMAVRRCRREDLERIAKATGASLVSTLANLEGEESFEAHLLGHADSVIQERFGDDECIVVQSGGSVEKRPAASIILRGATDMMLEEMQRALHDAMCVVQRTLETSNIVPGGGAVEAALSVYLEGFAASIASREQLAVAEFGEALLIIPKTLALNAACDASDLVARLRSLHHAAQHSPQLDDIQSKALRGAGLDLMTGNIHDSIKAGIIEPALVKTKALKSATEAAISILRIDDLIRLVDAKQQSKDPHADIEN